MSRIVLLFAALGLLSACQNTPQAGPPPTGEVLPTVAGRGPAAFANGEEAREAFTRRTENAEFWATLEDAAWLRFEGPPEQVEKNHRAYFEQGYTTFQIRLDSGDFTTPTQEAFVLEDSAGRRVTSRPLTYRSSMSGGEKTFAFLFNLSFEHAITADTQWIRLSREAVPGASLQWNFQ